VVQGNVHKHSRTQTTIVTSYRGIEEALSFAKKECRTDWLDMQVTGIVEIPEQEVHDLYK